MAERRESDQMLNTEVPAGLETRQEDSLVESLVVQLGVPEDQAKRYTRALYTAFSEEDPTAKIIDYLTSKIEQRGKLGLYKG